MDQFFADHLFRILKKVYLQTLKKLVEFFADYLLQILKMYTHKSSKKT